LIIGPQSTLKTKDNKDTHTSLNELEMKVLTRDYVSAETIIVDLISQFTKNKMQFNVAPFDRPLTQHQSELESYQVIEKLACIITSMFADKDYKISDSFFHFISMYKSFVSNLFAASSYHSTDHVAKSLGLLNKSNFTLDEIKRILILFGIESDIQLPWLELIKHLPTQVLQTITGLMGNLSIHFSPRAVKNINSLLEVVKHLPGSNVTNIKGLNPYLKAYFNCSNLAEENKYELKKWVVKTLELYVQNHIPPGIKKRLKSELKAKINKDKPHIIIACEHYKSNHAMYRGWHTSIAILKKHYKVTAIGTKDAFDTVSKGDFDNVVLIQDEYDIPAILKQFVKLDGDIALFTSVGMSVWAPLVSIVRVSPVQVALSGHPSSTYINNMDYYILSNCPYEKEQVSHIYSESLVQTRELWSDASSLAFNRKKFTELKPNNTMRVVVNGVIQKISLDTIEMCKSITDEVSTPVEFLFFMASPKQDIEYFAANSLLRRYLPNFKLIPFGSYQKYMDYLNSCDLALPTIPFGGSNSNVDVLRLAVPKLLYSDTTDVSSWSDLAMWKPTGLSERFICNSKAELKERAIHLLNNPDELMELESYIRSANPEAKLFTGNDELPYIYEALAEIIEMAD